MPATLTHTHSLEKIAPVNPALKSLLAAVGANEQQPIFLAENGEITNVILTYQQYQQLQPVKISLAEAFQDYHEPMVVDFDFQANRKSQIADSFEFD